MCPIALGGGGEAHRCMPTYWGKKNNSPSEMLWVRANSSWQEWLLDVVHFNSSLNSVAAVTKMTLW